MLYEEIIFFILHDRKREKKLVECFMASPGVSFKDVFSEINFKIGFMGLDLISVFEHRCCALRHHMATHTEGQREKWTLRGFKEGILQVFKGMAGHEWLLQL